MNEQINAPTGTPRRTWPATLVGVLLVLAAAPAADAQSLPGLERQIVHRPASAFQSFEIYGISAGMTPEAARDALVADGFEEKSPDRWGKVPTATFEKGRITVAITHLEGEITAVAKNHIWEGEELDVDQDLEGIQSHFDLTGDDAHACKIEPYGTQCGLNDGEPGGYGLVASLTPQMLFIRVGYRR